MENEALLFETTDKEPNNKYENINDLAKLQSSLDGTENDATSTEEKKMFQMIMNNEVEEISSDKDIEANYNESFSTKEIQNTNLYSEK